jgi:molybdopterin-containing oxidoreductase family iron-sulfur binding subunit
MVGDSVDPTRGASRPPLEPQAALLDPVSRRGFLSLLGASLGLAGLSGCSFRPPAEKILPYTRQPEQIVPGRPLYFATSMPLAGAAVGLLVESHEGRPTKVEGNPDHPASLGGTDAFAQASVLGLYDPDRSQTVLFQGRIRAWSEGLAALRMKLQELAKKDGGAGVRILTEAVASPSLADLIDGLIDDPKGAFPKARWIEYEPACLGADREGARLAFGEPLDVYYDYYDFPKEDGIKADRILTLDADFLMQGGGRLAYTRAYAASRQADGEMNRLYSVESTPGNAGMIADHRLALRPGQIQAVAQMLAHWFGVAGVPEPEGLSAETLRWLQTVRHDLEEHEGKSVVVAGDGQPPIVHALALAINENIQNVNHTVFLTPVPKTKAERGLAALKQLADDLDQGKVEFLLILGGNPAYTAPADLKFAERIKTAGVAVHLGMHRDETGHACLWHIPEAHYLESWGDARAFDGTASIIQPLIAPLYGDAHTASEMVSALFEESERTGHQIVRNYWQKRHAGSDFERSWERWVHDGVVAGTKAATKTPQLQADWAKRAGLDKAAPATKDGYDVVFRLDPTTFDGRFANNGWLQELPKPLSKLTWDNAALVSPKTAADLGVVVKEGPRGGAHGEMITDVVEVKFDEHRKVEAPVWIVPGCPDGVVTLNFGYGRERAGKVGSHAGFNAYSVWNSDAPYFEGGATAHKTGKRFTLACVQGHHRMDVTGLPDNKIRKGLQVVLSGTKEEYDRHPGKFLEEMGYEWAAGLLPEDDDRPRRELPIVPPPTAEFSDPYQWGMSIDLGACVGCGACVVACQAENNIPVVGKEEVTHGREMHWIRVDRYFEGDDADPARAYFQPLPCMHCENAPCEQVCPVEATVHSPDGLNEMIYNRCVGTRYCSNNCPYKVRRFNFLQYADFHTPSLKLLNNPDVTVRSRGVMEKCTYCVQRIRGAEIDAQNDPKRKGVLHDGDVVTACQAVCPAQAIVFGDIKDPKSRVMQKKGHPLNYGLLVDLNTRPRTTYTAALRNPNPALEPKAE